MIDSPEPTPPPSAPANDWVDLEAPRKAAQPERGLTLTIADDRDGRLSVDAAEWLRSHLPGPGSAVKVRLQRNVTTGEVSIVPSLEDGAMTVRCHRGTTLPRRFYCTRLMRLGLAKKGQVIKLRAGEGRLLLIGVKVPV